jgi:hypothetical protein
MREDVTTPEEAQYSGRSADHRAASLAVGRQVIKAIQEDDAFWQPIRALAHRTVTGMEAELAVALGPGPVERVEALETLAEQLELEADPEIVSAEREELERGWDLVEERGV